MDTQRATADARTRVWFSRVWPAALVALALVLIVSTNQVSERAPDVVAYLFAIGFGAALLLRRRLPRTVLSLSALGVFAYYTLDYPPIGVALPILAALFACTEAGHLWWSISTAAIVFVVSLGFRVFDGAEHLGTVVGYESVSNLALFAAAIALGDGVRTRRQRAAQQRQILALTDAQAARDADRAIQRERDALSRDLHDTVGHAMSVVAMQAAVADEAIEHDTASAHLALDRIRATSSTALQDLRAMVRLLRQPGEHAPHDVPSLAALEDVFATARATGLDVIAEIDVPPDTVPPSVDAAAYRVVQESLTNVVRHARASTAHVHVRLADDTVHLTIRDDGKTRAAAGGADHGHPHRTSGEDGTTGYGIVGMMERVRLLGGSLDVGETPGDGFVVTATIPARLM